LLLPIRPRSSPILAIGSKRACYGAGLDCEGKAIFRPDRGPRGVKIKELINSSAATAFLDVVRRRYTSVMFAFSKIIRQALC
jgi:hypothetical protein